MSYIISPFIVKFGTEEGATVFLFEKEVLPIAMNCMACGGLMVLTPVYGTNVGESGDVSVHAANLLNLLYNNFFCRYQKTRNLQLRALLFIKWT